MHAVTLRPPQPLPVRNDAPRIALQQLDSLWFQVTGTLCNLACTHCFISCSPGNRSFGFLSYEQVVAALEQSKSLGVKDYYFTGGEPFMHPRLLDMLDATLQLGPATVLTNGTLLPERVVQSLASSRDALDLFPRTPRQHRRPRRRHQRPHPRRRRVRPRNGRRPPSRRRRLPPDHHHGPNLGRRRHHERLPAACGRRSSTSATPARASS